QPDGKFVAAGYSFPNVSAKRAFALARYNPDGSLDPTFGSGGKRTTEFGNQASVQAVVVGDDGSIFAAGYSADEVAGDFALARYDEGGNPVSSFGSFGKVETNFVDDGNFGSDDVALDLAIQSDDKLVVAGYTNADFALARYAPTGALNATFGQDGKATTDFGSGDRAAALALQADARILAAGASGSDFALARYYGGSDDTAPKAQPPAQILLAGSTLGDPTVPVRLRWSATDHPGGSSIASYQLQRSTNGSPYATVSLPSAKATAVTPSLHPGKTYRFRVRALDETGNRSAWSYGPRFRVDASQERDGAVSYAGAWKPERLASAYGGAVKYATESGAWARLAFRGGSIAWVAPKGPNRGRAEVRLDGRKVATVDLYSQSVQARRTVFARNGLNPSVTHVLEVKALGTKRAASSGTRVEVDALVVVRRSGGG
ncbi:MAG: fibronectin type III domain-containing protein, partial [Actinomycetota bacterium]|nr:fibronectin type III domain-containing protein [Actinomycetota bacterium]